MKSPARWKKIAAGALVEGLEIRRLFTGIGYNLTDVAPFTTSGYQSNAGLLRDASGNLFGTTKMGGANNLGIVFKLANGSSTITTVASFNSSTGCYPTADLVMDGAGNLYGTTPFGGANGLGTVFKLAAGGNAITPLASFTAAATDIGSVKLVVDSHGNLFGTTPMGGTHSAGSVFEIVAGSGVITTLASFSSVTGDFTSSGLVEDSAGNLYGTTPRDGADGFGSIYKLANGSGSVTVLAPFTSINATLQTSALTLDSHGNLFGTTQFGGANGDGSVYELPSGGSTINTLVSFNSSNGANPSAPMLIDSSGNLWGTTAAGGLDGDGTVFEVLAGSGSITTLAYFNGTNGYAGTDGFSHNSVMPDLVSDTHGDFFGVAPGGGSNGLGTVYEISPQKASQVVVTQQPAVNVSAGAIQSIIVSMETANGVVDPTSTAAVTLSIAAGPTGAQLSGTLTATAVAGIATFNNVIFKTTGTYTLTAASTGLTSGLTTPITVIAGSGTKLVVVQQPTATVAGQIVSSIIADVQDTYGNLATGDSSTVNLTAPSGFALTGTASAMAVGGVVTFSNITINKAGTCTLTLADGSMSLVNTSSFVISAAAASQLTIVQQPPASVTAGQTIPTITVDVTDAFGNPIIAAAPTLAINTSGAALSGTTSRSASNGAANFSGLSISIAGTYTLTATSGGLTSATSNSFIVTAAAARQLVIVQQPAAAVTAGQIIGTVSVDVEDAFGNLVTSNAPSLSVQTTTTLAGTASVQPSAGVGSFAGLAINAIGTYTLSISGPGITAVNTTPIVVTAAPASELAVTQQPVSPAVAGSTISTIAVSVEDAFGNVITTDSSTMNIAVTSGVALAGTLSQTAVNGVATFGDLSINTAGSYSFTVTDGNLTAAVSTPFTVNPAAATQLLITQQPTTGVATQTLGAVIVTAEDAFGNVATLDQSSITLSASAVGGSGSNFNFSGTTTASDQQGVGTFGNLVIDTAGTYTLTASDGTLTPATSANITITTAPPPPPTPPGPGPTPGPSTSYTVIAGHSLSAIVINAKTDLGVTTGKLKFVRVQIDSTAANGSTVLTQNVPVRHGSISLRHLHVRRAGDYTVTINDLHGHVITEQLTIVADKASQINLAIDPSSAIGTSQIVVSAIDAYGNLSTSADGTAVHLTIGWHPALGGKPALSGTTSMLLSGGIASFANLSLTSTARILASAKGFASVLSAVVPVI